MLSVSASFFPIPQIPWDDVRKKSSEAIAWIGDKSRRYSHLVSQTITLALDIIFFVGKLSNRVPRVVTNGAFTCLNFMSVIALPYIVDLIKKSAIDVSLCYRSRNDVICALTALRTAKLMSDAGLILAGFAAAVVGMKGNEKGQQAIYKVTNPWGKITMAVSIALTVYYLFLSRSVLNKLRETSAEAIITAFEDIENPDSLMVQSHVCMDKDALADFFTRLKNDSNCKEELKELLVKSIEKYHRIKLGGDIFLKVLGYIFLSIQKFYPPNSLVSASINLGFGTAYTVKRFVESHSVGKK